jgi:transposase
MMAASATVAAIFMRYIAGEDRGQAALLPAMIDDYVSADAPVRVIDAFVEELDMVGLGFGRAVPASTGRPAYDPRDLLRLYIYGYFNEVRSSRRLERECRRNVEAMWCCGGWCRTSRRSLTSAATMARRSWAHAGPS